jgi:hypothetical protein
LGRPRQGSAIQTATSPTLAIPLAPVLANMVDRSIGVLLMLVLLLAFGVGWTAQLRIVPSLVVPMVLMSPGVSAWLSALDVQYRRTRCAMRCLSSSRCGSFAAPVIYWAADFLRTAAPDPRTEPDDRHHRSLPMSVPPRKRANRGRYSRLDGHCAGAAGHGAALFSNDGTHLRRRHSTGNLHRSYGVQTRVDLATAQSKHLPGLGACI